MRAPNCKQAEFVGTPQQYFERLAPAFDRAAPNPVDGWFRFGTRHVRVRFATAELKAVMSSGIAHLAVPPAASADLNLHVWDSATSGADPLPAPTTEKCVPRSSGDSTDVHCDYGFVADRYQFCFSYSQSGIKYNFLDHKTGNAYYWTPNYKELPAYEVAAPFRLTLHWWLRSAQCYLIHAGVVGTASGGVLVGGRGGSGKSTTCLTCASAGMWYASDDYVAVATEPSPVAYSLYCSAKLDDDSLMRFPELASRVVNPQRQEYDKAILFLPPGNVDGFSVVTQLPLVGIVMPQISHAAVPKITKEHASVALQGLGPSSMMQMPGATNAEFKVVAELARQLPTYRLDLAPEMEEVPGLISELIDRLCNDGGGV